MTRTGTSLLSFFFLCSATAAVPDDESRACSAADQSNCRVAPSWTQALAAEDEGLELLQFKGSEKTRKICPVPDVANYAPTAKYCPKHLPGENTTISTCVEKNRHFTQLENAWEKCGLLEDCGAVMQWSDGMYYLRRTTDPDSLSFVAGVKLWNYECQASKDEALALEKMADTKAKELIKEKRWKVMQKEKADFQEVNSHLQGELQSIKEETSRVEEEEMKLITEANLKEEALHEQAQKLQDTTAKVTKDATLAKERLDKANKLEAEAQNLIFHDEGLKMTKEQAAQKVAEETTELQTTNTHLQEISKEATSVAAQIKEIQARMDDVKSNSQEKIAKANVQTEAARAKKTKLVSELHDIALKKANVEEKLRAQKKKLKETQAELNDIEEQMTK